MAVLLAAALLLAGTPVLAQPGDGDLAAARAMQNACRSDIQRLCAGEFPGGGRILRCLDAQRRALTPVCRETVDAILTPPSSPPPPGPAMPPWAAMLGAADACREDAARLCPHVIPGGGRIIRCLMEQREMLTRRCRDAMAAARDALRY